MEIKHGMLSAQFGPGVSIALSGEEVASAIDAWLGAHGVHVAGARSVTVNGSPCEAARVHVDPSGFVIAAGQKLSGRGERSDAATTGSATASIPAQRLSQRMRLFVSASIAVIVIAAVSWYLVANWPQREYGSDVHGSADFEPKSFARFVGRA